MERIQILPFKKNVGVQLGVGIRNSALYLPSTSLQGHKGENWLYGGDTGDQQIPILELDVKSQEPLVDFRSETQDLTNATDGTGTTHESDITSDFSDSEFNSSRIYQFGPEALGSSDLDSPGLINLFRNVNLSSEPGYEAKSDTPIAAQEYVPRNVLNSVEGSGVRANNAGVQGNSHDYWNPAQASDGSKPPLHSIDPTDLESVAIGLVHTTADLRMNKDARHVISYSSGDTGSVLNLALLMQSDAPGLCCSSELLSINLNSRVKNIKFPTLSPSFGRSSDTLAALTENGLTVLRIKSIDDHTGKLAAEAPISLGFSSLEDFPFADVSFNPWDINEFAIIDVKGNWCIGTRIKRGARESRLRLSSNKRGTLYDPEELSSWRRLEWGSEYFRLIAVSRGRLVEIDLNNRSQLEIIQAKSWSSLRDYKRIDEQFSLITTSKEVIFVNLRSSNIERILSWKHDLNPDDTTLKSEVCRIVKSSDKEHFFVFIYSRLTTQVWLHFFYRNGSAFQSIGDSSLLEFGPLQGGFSTLIISQLDHSKTVSSEENSDHVHLFAAARDATSNIIWKYAILAREFRSKVTGGQPTMTLLNEDVSDVQVGSKQDFVGLHPFLPIPSAGHDMTKDIEAFQQYGYQISEGMNKQLGQWTIGLDGESLSNQCKSVALDDLATPIGYIESMEEFGSLLQQFKDHYKDHDVWFADMPTLSTALLKEPVVDLGVLYNKLLQCWDFGVEGEECITRDILKGIVMKNTGICSVSALSSMITLAYEQLGQESQNLIDVWDEPDPIEEDNTVPQQYSSLFQNHSQASQIPPSIKSSQHSPPKARKLRGRSPRVSSQSVSQPVPSTSNASGNTPRTLKTHASNVLPDTMTPAFTLSSASQHVPTLSQSQNSQRQRKKKKRLGGFG
ncbi:Rrn6p [Lachancea thermotolerans]